MARLAHSLGEKGSQKWIRKLVNEEQEILNSRIRKNLNLPNDERIEWLSPLKSEGYKEYRDEAFLEKLRVKLEKVPLSQFWPEGGPQWDALGRSSSGKLFLVEAKSHISELKSTSKAKSDNSRERIQKSLQETKDCLNSKSELDWSKCFYQYTNRLAHVHLLKTNGLPAYLVFVYFINDLEMRGPTTVNEWEDAIRLVNSRLGIERHRLKEFVTDVFIDLNRL
jgi:hypothetical protein